MQVSIENVSKLERKLTVKIPAAQLDTQVQSRLNEMGRNIRLKGFRPGKVPVKVIEQRYGSQVRGEALSELIRNTFQEAVAQQKLRPAMAPAIATNGQPSNGEIEYTATFEVLPEMGKIEVNTLAITKPVANVEDADVEQMIKTLRMQRRIWTPVERAAQIGDMVLFEYSAQAADFRFPEKDGKERVGTVLGSGAMLKELEDQLVGYKANDAIEIDFAFPAGFQVAGLAGKLARVEIKIMRVQEPQLPELDATFVASFGVKDGDIEHFRADVRANLERELAATLNGRLKSQVVDKLVDAYPALELPQGMIDAEARALASQVEAQARQQGQTVTQQPEAFYSMAKRRVAAALLLGEIAQQADIRLDSKRVANLLANIASTYEEPEKVIELYSKDPQLMNGLKNRVLEDQVADWVVEQAQVSEQTLNFSEVMRPNTLAPTTVSN